jgi:PAS domain S-box-containing protein
MRTGSGASSTRPVAIRGPRHLVGRWAPPIRQREFWIVQVLVLLIAGAHVLVEASDLIALDHATFIPVSLFLLPVIYAALAFGIRGSAPTAVWCALLTVPNTLIWHTASTEMLGEIWQAGLVVAVGMFVGRRIDAERRARTDAERRDRERRASEDKYRTVFDSAGDAIILLDQGGAIQEVNAAAATLLGGPADRLRLQPFDSCAPPELRAVLADGSDGKVAGPITASDGHRLWLAPVRTSLTDASGRPLSLLLLRDVSLQVERQQLLEGYGEKTLAAREEERRRIARELHDGPLQSVVQLWRRLDGLDVADPDLPIALASARATAEEVGAELRRFSRDLRPSLLDDLGLDAALRAEAESFEGRTSIRGRYGSRGEIQALDAREQLAIFRVCQEALHNVERHARASSVSVRLSVSSTRAELVVEDDGIGMANAPDPAELVRQGKLGVVGMQERARLIEGTCTVGPGRNGTVVRLSAPRQSRAT